MIYAADYGFITETLALDGDPLDVLVIVSEPTFPQLCDGSKTNWCFSHGR
jgi:inorganic pyrophosphatase